MSVPNEEPYKMALRNLKEGVKPVMKEDEREDFKDIIDSFLNGSIEEDVIRSRADGRLPDYVVDSFVNGKILSYWEDSEDVFIRLEKPRSVIDTGWGVSPYGESDESND